MATRRKRISPINDPKRIRRFFGHPNSIKATPGFSRRRTTWVRKWMTNNIFSSVLVDGAIYGFDLHDIQAKRHRPSVGIIVTFLASGHSA